MKNILFTLFAILILTSCSKDDDNWIELNENNIVGNWSTGIKGAQSETLGDCVKILIFAS